MSLLSSIPLQEDIDCKYNGLDTALVRRSWTISTLSLFASAQ
jgi:hypothetical protein